MQRTHVTQNGKAQKGTLSFQTRKHVRNLGSALFDDQQYEESIQTLSGVLVRPNNTKAQKIEIYRLLALNYITLTHKEEAEGAVRGLLALEPTYALPDPWVGYQPAYGAAYSVQPASADGSTQTDQVVVVASVKNGFAIVVLEEGALLPRVTSNSPYFNGHPSPARVNMAYGFGDFIVNRIRFPTRSR